MTKDEELEQLRAEKTVLCERLRRKDEELEQSQKANHDLREGLKQAIMAIESQQERVKTLEGLIDSLHERIKTLEGQQAKDSHNSSLPPSSDRFVRPPKSLRKKRSEEHTSELQSLAYLVCRLLLEKKKRPLPLGPHGRTPLRDLPSSPGCPRLLHELHRATREMRLLLAVLRRARRLELPMQSPLR